MPGFGDTTFIVLLALLLFGPKKLPVLARQLGKLMADFRRASNEFKTQMEEELRISEQAERQKQIAAIESAAPKQLDPIPEPEHPHLPPPMEAEISSGEPAIPEHAIAEEHPLAQESPYTEPSAMAYSSESVSSPEPSPALEPTHTPAQTASAPVPIASSGSINLMPPATGLPLGRGTSTSQAASHTATEVLEPTSEHNEEAEARPWRI